MYKLLNLMLFMMTVMVTTTANGQTNTGQNLTPKQQAIVHIAAQTGKGDLEKLKTALNAGLESELTVNQIKEILVHVYAYAGFPRSIRGLQTFMTTLDERKAKGINDVIGAEASPIVEGHSKYDRGKAVLDTLLGAPQNGPQTGYSAFAPTIEIFLKTHLFADIFERDVLTYTERELATISILAAIGNVEPMLQSHLKICLNTDLTANQLQQFVKLIKSDISKKDGKSAQSILDAVLKSI